MLYFPRSYNVTMTLIFLMFSAFGINSILYQRGIYPSETFTRVQKYGLTLLVTTDPELIKYLNNVVDQLKGILLLDTVLSFAGVYVNRILWSSQVTLVKNPPANVGDTEDSGSILGLEDPLEKEMPTHSSILPRISPWTEGPVGLQSVGL